MANSAVSLTAQQKKNSSVKTHGFHTNEKVNPLIMGETQVKTVSVIPLFFIILAMIRMFDKCVLGRLEKRVTQMIAHAVAKPLEGQFGSIYQNYKCTTLHNLVISTTRNLSYRIIITLMK